VLDVPFDSDYTLYMVARLMVSLLLLLAHHQGFAWTDRDEQHVTSSRTR
jgi:hypothetical protein